MKKSASLKRYQVHAWKGDDLIMARDCQKEIYLKLMTVAQRDGLNSAAFTSATELNTFHVFITIRLYFIAIAIKTLSSAI